MALASAADQYRQSDIVFWGIAALVAGAIALLSANVSAILPDSVLAGLHASRLQGADINQLRHEILNLQLETGRLRQENALLSTRFTIAEQNDNTVVRRVGALEVSIPKLLEVLPPSAEVDRSTVTSSIGSDSKISFDAEGGSVTVREEPFLPAQHGMTGSDQPMPALPAQTTASARPDPAAYGVALGAPVGATGANAAWRDLLGKVGPLLLGLEPLVGDRPESQGRLVAGPLNNLAEADQLCGRFEQIGVTCTSVPYSGAIVSR